MSIIHPVQSIMDSTKADAIVVGTDVDAGKVTILIAKDEFDWQYIASPTSEITDEQIVEWFSNSYNESQQ